METCIRGQELYLFYYSVYCKHRKERNENLEIQKKCAINTN